MNRVDHYFVVEMADGTTNGEPTGWASLDTYSFEFYPDSEESRELAYTAACAVRNHLVLSSKLQDDDPWPHRVALRIVSTSGLVMEQGMGEA